MEASKGRLAMAEALELHRRAVASAQAYVDELHNQLQDARATLDARKRAQGSFVASMKGSARVRGARKLSEIATGCRERTAPVGRARG